VRDDFWMPLTRFAALLDIELVQGQNLAAVDLFDLAHARQVLIAFGRAFGQIGAELTGENEWFLDEAVQALAQDGRIISIRLAIFAEMMKHRKWTPATWQAVGGLAGVGLTFLEETVGAAIASPRMRRHRTAILATLRELLPPLGTRIRGGMKSYEHLLEKSGYADRPKEFDEVLKLLSTELRLITPTEPAGAEEGAEQPGSARYYQLIHDYLVLALQQWLVRKQGETPRGRAELRLELCTGAWETSKHDVRMLPSFWEWLSILQLTKWRLWTEPQRHLMRAANWHHGLRGAAVFGIIVLVAGLALGGWELHQSRQQSLRVDDMVQQLLDADSSQVVEIAHELQRVRPQSEPLLRKALAEAEQAEGNATTDAERTKEARYRLHASLALALYDRTQLTYLYNQLLAANAQDFGMIRDSLSTYKAELVGRLWEVATAPPVKEQEQRLRAASALATYAPDVDGWSKVGGPVAEQLLAVGPDSLGLWMEALRPVRDKLLAPLKTVFRAQAEDRTSAYIAAGILADYAADKPDDLIDLMLDADEKQFVVLSPKLKGDPERVASGMEAALGQQAGENASDDQKDRLAKRRANAAAMLLKLGRPTQVWQFLVHRPDGRERAYLIHRLAPLGIEPAVLTGRLFPGNGVQPVVGPALAPPASRAERLVFDPDKSVARALILSLGEFGPSQLSPSDQESLLPRLLQLYQGDPDPGLHGACEWLLRKWQQGPQLEAIDQKLATGKIEGQRGWYVNGQQQTLVVVPGPSDVEMGSPPTEIGREEDAERPKKKTIDRSFAIATKEVTVKQFLLFNAQKNYNRQFARTPDCPVDNVIWYEAAAYCNWLSEQENIPQGQWCYLANADRKYAEGMKTAPNYLTLQGYRLPTEAEWELACRAGSRTSRYYGESADLLGYYAWYTKNSRDQEMLPVGTLRPNDLGLFDMLGNVMEWTMGEVANSAALANEKDGDDVESPDDADAIKDTARVSRGGSFLSYTLNVRAAFRNWIKPSFASKVIGFRPARTIH